MNRAMRCVALTLSSLSFCFAAVRTVRELVTDQRTPSGSDVIVLEPESFVEPRALSVPDRITRGLGTEPDEWLDSLARFLTQGLQSDSHKVRAIHDWVTLSVDYDTTCLPSGVGDQCVVDVLRTHRSACGGYANLFGELCRRSGLRCVTIHGYARGAGFRVFGPEAPSRLEHAWNAVAVDGRWRLVDATWDAGRYLDDGRYEQHHSTDYLFPDPAWFIHTHFPADPSWQLLDRPVSALEFGDLPLLSIEFFRLGLRLGVPLGLVNEFSGAFTLELAVPDSVSVFCWLTTPDGRRTGSPIDGVRTGERVVFSFSPPAAGEWVTAVFAKPGTPGGQYSGVSLFGLRTKPLPDH